MSEEAGETPSEDEDQASRLKYEVPADPILITGATSGIGRALAHMVASRHAPLIVHGRDRARTEALVEELKPLSDGALVELVIADLAEQKEVRAMAAQVADNHSSLHALVNNAGVI